jgi:hypothetical protein
MGGEGAGDLPLRPLELFHARINFLVLSSPSEREDADRQMGEDALVVNCINAI